MKQFIVGMLCLCIGCTGAFGQIVKISMGTPLTGADWRFKPGNNPAWADSAFNASAWEEESPDTEMNPAAVSWPNNQGWYRTAFKPDIESINQNLLLTVTQFGSSVIYLDGKLLTTLKPQGFDSGGSQRVMQFIPVRFADTNQHVLAIRYQFRRDPIYGLGTIKPMDVSLRPANDTGIGLIDAARFKGSIGIFIAGALGMLALLHLLFYRANRAGRINRTLAWTMLMLFVCMVADDAKDYAGTLTGQSILESISLLGISAGFALLLTAVYEYLRMKKGLFFYSTVGLLTASLIYQLTANDPLGKVIAVPYTLAFAAYIRASWLGRRSGSAGARLPWNALRFALYSVLALFLYGMVIGFIGSKYEAKLDGLVMIPLLFFTMTMLFSIPVGLSLSLVRDYAQTHEALGSNLREVEQLSARTLAQEQEKQHLLARQNELLDQQVHERTAELNQSLTELRATQMQLVQREKLASLGELTAGIAHEIQNPLNFVTNFAEVSVELVDELNVEQNQPADQRDNVLIEELLGDLGQNVQKISEHGKRAASIVRGMLQHSRASTGQKQPTNLNALVDESMKLAYHGLRATDKNFNAHLQTNFASDVPTVSIVPEDVGRVLVNLFNNAFYAVKQAATLSAGPAKPTVSVQTVLDNGQVVIRVADNGPGITDAVRQKIFQPFFTTKPTGQGTGLGLSISYDIITKGHGGTLSVDTQPGNTVFTIRLPLQQA